MLWNQIVQFIFGGTLIVAQPMLPSPLQSQATQTQATLDELLSYECAKSVAGLVYPEDQSGPLFSDYGLVFTSVEAQDNSRLLLVSAGSGTYSVPLKKAGVNRIRFAIPTQGSARPTMFYLGYLHDPISSSRVFDISREKPPTGKEAADYTLVHASHSQALVANLDYSVHETVNAMLGSLTEGRLQRNQVQREQVAANCEHIARKNPALGRNLKRNLEVVEMLVRGPQPQKSNSRMPASVAKNR